MFQLILRNAAESMHSLWKPRFLYTICRTHFLISSFCALFLGKILVRHVASAEIIGATMSHQSHLQLRPCKDRAENAQTLGVSTVPLFDKIAALQGFFLGIF